MSTNQIAETVKEATPKIEPWGFWYKNAPVLKNGISYMVFGKPVRTIQAAKDKVDNAYTSLSKSIK